MRFQFILASIFALSTSEYASAFVNPSCKSSFGTKRISTSLYHGHPGGHPTATMANTEAPSGFIDTELRGAAMKLHTRKQAPKEGEAEEAEHEKKPYVTTHDDYLRFLIDSQHVYKAFEDAVNANPNLEVFRNTGLERSEGLEKDIKFMLSEYGDILVERHPVGSYGLDYAKVIEKLAKENQIPAFICHYYNYYFAHTAGGRMIGKQMSALLLDKKTLEFYKVSSLISCTCFFTSTWNPTQTLLFFLILNLQWDGDLNEIKTTVKNDIEEIAASWSAEEKQSCVDETASAFQGGGGINAYLYGGGKPAH